MTKQSQESKVKKLQIKYAHERDALTWALDKAFEVAKEEMDCDDVFHFDTLARMARVYELGESGRWAELSDEIHSLMATEDIKASQDVEAAYAELKGDIERDEHD